MGAVNTLINLIKMAPLARTALSVPGALSVTAITDLPAASTVPGKIYFVTNPAGNTRAIPWQLRSNGTIWESVGAFQMLATSAVPLGYVAPNNTTFSTITTVATGSGGTGGGAGSSTKITGTGAHGLTNAISAGKYMNITGGTGWTAGLVKIVDADANANILELDVPFTSQGIPTYSTKTAEVELFRIKVPPLNANSFVIVDMSWSANGSSGKKLRVRYGDLGEAIATADEYSGPNVTSGTGNGTIVKIQNVNNTAIQTGGIGNTTTGGSGASSGTVPATTTATGSVITDIIFTANPQVNNELIQMERYHVMVAY